MNISFGNRGIIGQSRAKESAERILASGRISHSYIISGPPGVGKTAFALAFAEAINGINNLSELGEQAFSRKSTWFNHPDIKVFLPFPKDVGIQEMYERLEMLSKDPYEIVSFLQRPSMGGSGSKNKQAFYHIDYFREIIRPQVFLKPNEGKRTVIILTEIETMKKEAANAFLKILEEPNDRVMFILTTASYESLLPTITSRCQHIPLSTLKEEEIRQGLMNIDGLNADEATYLARISGGNYAATRFYDTEQLKSDREDVVNYLRLAYSHDAVGLTKLTQNWQTSHNIESLIALTNLIEIYIRDLIVYRETGNDTLITNIDQIESIRKFVSTLKKARLEEMIAEVNGFRPMLRQNVNAKLIFVVLAFRFFNLMRGYDIPIPQEENHKHLAAFVP